VGRGERDDLRFDYRLGQLRVGLGEQVGQEGARAAFEASGEKDESLQQVGIGVVTGDHVDDGSSGVQAGNDELAFARPPAVERPEAGSRAVGDIAHRERVIPAFVDQVPGGSQHRRVNGSRAGAPPRCAGFHPPTIAERRFPEIICPVLRS
jgi:hypothetical protein